jgi:hypothetical protein
LAFFDMPGLFVPDVDEVHVSVTFTYDLSRGERMAREWRHIAPVSIGGPATGAAGGDFTPGRYLKPGYVITSRGCPNKCWFCQVWRREGEVRELPVTEGYNVLDDNLLACSVEHIKAVFTMLARQKEPARFTGGLEAARLKSWHAEALGSMRIHHLFLAYDEPADYEPLRVATSLLFDAGLGSSHKLRCYVLVGHPKDTFTEATERLEATLRLGLFPMAMLYRDKHGHTTREWRQFARGWAAPAAVGARANNLTDLKESG